MISVYVRLVAGVITLALVIWAYGLAMQMAAANRRERRNGSTGAVLRTIKRRLTTRGIRGLVMVWSAWYSWRWLNIAGIDGLGPLAPLFASGGVTFTIFGILDILDTVLDVTERDAAVDIKIAEERQSEEFKDWMDGINRRLQGQDTTAGQNYQALKEQIDRNTNRLDEGTVAAKVAISGELRATKE